MPDQRFVISAVIGLATGGLSADGPRRFGAVRDKV